MRNAGAGRILLLLNAPKQLHTEMGNRKNKPPSVRTQPRPSSAHRCQLLVPRLHTFTSRVMYHDAKPHRRGASPAHEPSSMDDGDASAAITASMEWEEWWRTRLCGTSRRLWTGQSRRFSDGRFSDGRVRRRRSFLDPVTIRSSLGAGALGSYVERGKPASLLDCG